MNIAQALDIWERALQEEIGLVINFENGISDAKHILYKARQLSKNPEYENFIICSPGDAPNELIMVRKTVELD